MTLADERYRAFKYARQLMLDLLDPKVTPRVSKAIRLRARSALKHYAQDWELDSMANSSPKMLSKGDK